MTEFQVIEFRVQGKRVKTPKGETGRVSGHDDGCVVVVLDEPRTQTDALGRPVTVRRVSYPAESLEVLA